LNLVGLKKRVIGGKVITKGLKKNHGQEVSGRILGGKR